MKFFYSQDAGCDKISLVADEFSHFKARRYKIHQRVDVRNLKDGANYIYEIIEIKRSEAILELTFKHSIKQQPPMGSIIWAITDNQTIEKTLPSINEMGIENLFLVYSDFSQKNIKINFKRLEKILINSSQQCGRNSILNITIYNSSDDIQKCFKNIYRIDFGSDFIKTQDCLADKIFFIGPEGGFSKREKELIKNYKSLKSDKILKSSTAIIATIAKVFL